MRNLPVYLTAAAVLIAALILANRPEAQSVPPGVAAVITTCGTLSSAYTANTFAPITVNTAGSLCVNQ